MSHDNDDADESEDEADNQYGGGEQDIDAVEQTERVMDDDEQSTEESDEE